MIKSGHGRADSRNRPSAEPAGIGDHGRHIRTYMLRARKIPARKTTVLLAVACGGWSGLGTFVHCEHGEDRTGLAVGAYRIKVEHWTKPAAYQEMEAPGFHPLLRGLYRASQEDIPNSP